jgi:Ca2+-binding EF-hand superfamily protein
MAVVVDRQNAGEPGYKPMSAKAADKDNSGHLSREEFKAVLSRMAQYDTEEKVNAAVAAVDSDADGKISYAEWVAANEAD